MKSMSTVKRISSTGDSKIITVTKEAKELGLDRGDSIAVILGNPSAEDLRIMELAKMISSSGGDFRNIRWLKPGDTGPDGEPISGKDDEVPEDVKEDLIDYILATEDIQADLLQDVRGRMPKQFAYYSESQRSCLSEITNDRRSTSTDHAINISLIRMKLIQSLLSDTQLDDLEVPSYRDLIGIMDIFVRDIASIREDSRGRDYQTVKSRIASRKDEWDQTLRRELGLNAWYLAVITTQKDGGNELSFEYYTDVPFLSEARMRFDDSIDDWNSDHDGKRDAVLFGPFEYESEASELLGFLKMDAMMRKIDVDDAYMDRLRRLAREVAYNGIAGLNSETSKEIMG